LIEHSEKMGELMLMKLFELAEKSPVVCAVRGKGLFAGIELNPALADARQVAERLLSNGILTKDTHHTVLRLAPPLIIQREDLLWGLERIAQVLNKNFCCRPVAA
jgi:ornithine--oxo-acid transaminase